jgi:hypothetical protein
MFEKGMTAHKRYANPLLNAIKPTFEIPRSEKAANRREEMDVE